MARVPLPEAKGDDAVSASVLAHQPKLLHAFQRLYGTLWSHGVVDHATKEVARLRNARTTGCGYCKNVRFAAARDEGLTEERVATIGDDFERSALLDDRQKLVIRYVDAFLDDPAGLDDEVREEMLREFSPAEIVELTAGIALFLGFSKIAVALGQAPASMPTTVVPTPTRPAD